MFWYLIVMNASIKKIFLHCDCARAGKFPERVKGPQHSSISVVKRNVSEMNWSCKRFTCVLRMQTVKRKGFPCCLLLSLIVHIKFFAYNIRDLKQGWRRRQWKRRLKKMNLRSFKLNRVYLDPLNMSNAGDFSWSWILKDFIHVKKDERRFVVVCPRPP